AILLGAGASSAADLTKVDRTIKKEPAYQTKPTYCLLVFGPKARDRVWLVLDGDILYVDRNGNGDLTEEGESIKAAALSPRNELGHRERSIEVSDISVAGLTHRGLLIRQVEHPRNRVVYTVTISLDPKCYGIFTDTKELRVRHRAGQLVFAERP